jgi:hypothetical protein
MIQQGEEGSAAFNETILKLDEAVVAELRWRSVQNAAIQMAGEMSVPYVRPQIVPNDEPPLGAF